MCLLLLSCKALFLFVLSRPLFESNGFEHTTTHFQLQKLPIWWWRLCGHAKRLATFEARVSSGCYGKFSCVAAIFQTLCVEHKRVSCQPNSLLMAFPSREAASYQQLLVVHSEALYSKYRNVFWMVQWEMEPSWLGWGWSYKRLTEEWKEWAASGGQASKSEHFCQFSRESLMPYHRGRGGWTGKLWESRGPYEFHRVVICCRPEGDSRE